MLKKAIVAAIASATLSMGAHAADSSTVSAHDWTGFYAGVNGGYGWGDAEIENDSYGFYPQKSTGISPVTGTYSGSTTVNPDGALGGLQLGYRFQSGRYVFGAEADFQAASIHKTETTPNGVATIGGVSTAGTTYNDVEIERFGTLRGVLGYDFGPTLIYATGGLAYGHAEVSVSNTFKSGIKGKRSFGSDSNSHVGFALGAGFERALSEHVSVKFEYLHMDLGSEDYSYTYQGNTFLDYADATNEVDLKVDTIRMGLNYQF